MNNLNEITVRIKADTLSFDNPIDVLRGEIPQFWRGNDVRFEIGIFFGESALGVSDYASISLAIRKMTEDGMVPPASAPALMQKICASLDGTLTEQTWANGTKQHAIISFSSEESNVIPGDHWISIWATTASETPKIVTLCAGVVRILEVGGGNISIPPDPMVIYYTANECDGKFVKVSSIDTSPALGQSNALVPSQKAVKSYVDSATQSGGEANTASNLGIGTGIFSGKSGIDLRFKSLKEGKNIAISSDSSTVTISSHSGSPGEGMVNPMTSAGDIIIGGTEGMAIRFGKGATGQVLKSTETGLAWENDAGGIENPMTTVDDMIIGGENGTPARLAVGTEGQVLKVESGTVQWSDMASYEFPVATTTDLGGIIVGDRLTISDGVLSADNQSYTLPIAASNTLGGIKPDGTTLTVNAENGVASATVGMENPMTNAGDMIIGGTSGAPTKLTKGSAGKILKATEHGIQWDDETPTYTLPIASSDTLGGIKIGTGLAMANGVLSSDGYTLPTASSDTLGGIKVGNGLAMANGVLSSDGYTLQIASPDTLGGIKPDGTTLTVSEETGIASVIGGGSGGWVPSDEVVTITIGASGSSYTVPADGWLNLFGSTGSNNSWMRILLYKSNGTDQIFRCDMNTYSSARNLGFVCPVAFDNVFTLMYSTMDVITLRFVYSKDSQNSQDQ
ncbi:MAG: hypothetical protein LBB18_00325 [Puniceicoccales bacterium]|jgi:hypothetical protein|nr:hypothetical protein [Puniceicoccales bacterium]